MKESCRGCQNPWTGTAGAVVALGVTFAIALRIGLPAEGTTPNAGGWMALILGSSCLGMLMVEYRIQPPRLSAWADIPRYHQSWKRLAISAAWRYAIFLTVISAFYWTFTHRPYYVSDYFEPFRAFLRIAYRAFLILGYPYALITLRWKGGRREDLTDTAILLMAAGRALARTAVSGSRKRGVGRLTPSRIWAAAGGIAVEAFFIPLMTVFMYFHLRDLSNAIGLWQAGPQAGFARYETGYQILFHSLILMDVSIAVIGYVLPSRWLDNKIRSVEPTVIGWVVAVGCYPPFNNFIFRYLIYEANPAYQIIHSEPVRLALMGATLALLAVYVWATLAFGFRFSNLTHRGIIARGPYAYVRHPAYIAKNLSWWTEMIPYLGNPIYIVSLVAWNFIYVLRALTEEDHLSWDPEYREYCRHVRHRFIPGVY